jgi:hypothetical protein
LVGKDESTLNLKLNTSAELYHSSKANVFSDSTCVAHDEAIVCGFDHSTVTGKGNAFIHLDDYANAKGYDKAYIKLYKNCHADFFGDNLFVAHDNCTVSLMEGSKAKMDLDGYNTPEDALKNIYWLTSVDRECYHDPAKAIKKLLSGMPSEARTDTSNILKVVGMRNPESTITLLEEWKEAKPELFALAQGVTKVTGGYAIKHNGKDGFVPQTEYTSAFHRRSSKRDEISRR